MGMDFEREEKNVKVSLKKSMNGILLRKQSVKS